MPKAQRLALVTGANRGIGFAIAKGLAAKAGIKVLAAARRSEDATVVARQLGNGTIGLPLDLADPPAVYARAQSIEAEFGSIDILINNAGTLQEGGPLEVNEDDLIASLAVNAVAPYGLIRAIAPGMIERKWGRIVNVSSGWGSFAEGLTGPAAYSISKATLNALTVSFAQALPSQVKINAVSPGWVRTRMGGDEADRSPEEGAAGAIWLATLTDKGPTGGFFRDKEQIEW